MVKSGKASRAAAAADGLEKECFWNGLRHSLLHLIVSISASIPVSAQCELAVGEGGCPFEKQQKQNLVPSFIQNGCYLYFSFQSKSPGWVHPASDRRYLSLCGSNSLSLLATSAQLHLQLFFSLFPSPLLLRLWRHIQLKVDIKSQCILLLNLQSQPMYKPL